MRLAAFAVLPLLAVPSAGPVLTPDGPVWTTGGSASVRIMGGTPPRVLHRVTAADGGRSGNELTVGLSGSSEGFVYAATSLSGTPHQLCGSDCFSPVFGDVGIGSPRGVRVVESGSCPIGSAEASSEALAFVRSRCGSGDAPVLVARGSGGQREVAGATGPEAAGRYAGWTESAPERAAVVWDAVAGREVARFAGAGLADVQPDGKLLLRLPGDGAAWATAGDPAVHALPLRLEGAARLVADRVLAPSDGSSSGLTLVGLDGSRRTVVEVAGDNYVSRFDLGADRLVWSRPTCDGAEIRTQTLAEQVRLVSRVTCPTKLAGPARLTGGTEDTLQLSVPVRCGNGSLVPCDEVTITTARPVRFGRGRARVQVVGEVLFGDGIYEDPDPDGEASLTAQGERLLARTGRLRIRVRLKKRRSTVTTLRASPAALRVLRRR
jgi:hypothetical protein